MKSRGQHFLVDSPVVHQILEAAEVGPGVRVVEVGPGPGVLTHRLVESGASVVAFEIDPGMVRLLKIESLKWGPLEIVEGDVLDAPIAEHVPADPPEGSYRWVANLPYAITAPALRKFLSAGPLPDRAVIMVQKEVGDRLVARPGQWSWHTVLAALYGTSRQVCVVHPDAFWPRPKVTSVVIRLDLVPQELPAPRPVILRTVFAAFREPRKQLHNALTAGFVLTHEQAVGILAEAGIDGQRRAQTLSLEEWLRLFPLLQGREKAGL